MLGAWLLGASTVNQVMALWKYVVNRFMTKLESVVFGLSLAEFNTGYRALRADALRAVNLEMNSDNFIFDQEIMAQFVDSNLRITEVPVPTRYFPQASSASFLQSSSYGFSILWLLFRYLLHKRGILRQRSFESLQGRDQTVPRLP